MGKTQTAKCTWTPSRKCHARLPSNLPLIAAFSNKASIGEQDNPRVVLNAGIVQFALAMAMRTAICTSASASLCSTLCPSPYHRKTLPTTNYLDLKAQSHCSRLTNYKPLSQARALDQGNATTNEGLAMGPTGTRATQELPYQAAPTHTCTAPFSQRSRALLSLDQVARPPICKAYTQLQPQI
jgi:hypothetical protein